MLIHFLWFACLILSMCIVYFRIEKSRDRTIKKDLRDLLEIERRQKEASLEFNAYFLNNYGKIDAVSIGLNSKYYILYNKSGQAVIEERPKEFSVPEKLFYGLNDQRIQH